MSKGFNHKDTSYFERKEADEQKKNAEKMHRNFANKNNHQSKEYIPCIKYQSRQSIIASKKR